MKRYTQWIVFILFALLVAPGCDSDSGSDESELDGVWVSTDTDEELLYLDIDLPRIDVYLLSEELDCYITFRINAERTSGDTFEVTDEDGEVFTSEFRVEGEVLTIEDGGEVITFVRSSVDVDTLPVCEDVF